MKKTTLIALFLCSIGTAFSQTHKLDSLKFDTVEVVKLYNNSQFIIQRIHGSDVKINAGTRDSLDLAFTQLKAIIESKFLKPKEAVKPKNK